MRALIILFILLSVTIFPQQMEREPIGSNLYSREDYSYIQNGEAPNFFSRPYSNQRSLIPQPDNGYFIEPQIGISISPRYTDKNFPDSELSYWYNRWMERSPLLTLGFKTGNDYFIIDSPLDIRHDFFTGTPSSCYINIPLGDNWYQDFDFNFPTRGYIAVGSRDLELFIGRDKMKFGPGQHANLMVSSDASFFNQLNLSYQNPKFKGTFFFIPLESYLTDQEEATIDTFISSDSEYIPSNNYGKDISEQSKYLTGHRYEFRPYRNLILSFTDMLLLGGRISNFEDISPTMFYHNVYGENYSNVMIGFDIFWTITNGLAIYGEFIIDDIRNSYEKEYSVPTSLGYLGGFRYNIPFLPGQTTISFEAAYTDPFTYERWHPYMAFYTRRKLFSTSIGENRYLDSPIGFFLGSDSIFFTCWIDYLHNNRLNISLGWELHNQGDSNNLTGEDLIIAYEDNSDREYTIRNIVYLKSNYIFNKNLSIGLTERLIISDSINNIVSLSFNWTL